MARKKKKQAAAEAAEGEELQEGKKKKKGKKKLLLLLILVLVIAAAAAAVFFLDIGGLKTKLGLGKKDPAEPEIPKDLETYTVGEDSVSALDSILEEGECILLVAQKVEQIPKALEDSDPEDSSEEDSSEEAKEDSSEEEGDGSDEMGEQYLYIYDVVSPAAVVDKYLDAVLGGEQGMTLLDEESIVSDERPVLEDSLGTVTLAKTSTQEGHLFQVVIGWSEASCLTLRVSAPEGVLQYPEVEDPLDLATLAEQMDQLKNMDPKELGLSGASMDEYEIYAGEGFVTVDGTPCRKFNIYERRAAGDKHYTNIVGIYLFSTDKKHIYILDTESNMVSQLK
ncbi:hypothetical protein D7V91_06700 [bacterium 1xD42-67]|nr:hypothetical protein D7V91_06700 [bacterium 1xD42-67]